MMRKLGLLAALLVFGFTGCDDEDVREGKRLVAEPFRDPNSAQFRKIRRVRSDNGEGKIETAICGEVNSKNSAGGYTGFHRFVAFPETKEVAREVEFDQEELDFNDRACLSGANQTSPLQEVNELTITHCKTAKYLTTLKQSNAILQIEWLTFCRQSSER